MVRRTVAAIMMCAVMALVALVPLVAGGDWIVVKGPQGPRASAVTWTFEPIEQGVWTAKIDNSGLRWLVLDVSDNTTGIPEALLHQRIRFAAYDAYPTGTVISGSVQMSAGHIYEITATPNGPRTNQAVISDQFVANKPPVAAFTWTTSHLTVNVDATNSTDPDGWITDYVWNWGDGSPDQYETVPTAMHTYAMPGEYLVTLIVADNVGVTDDASALVTVVDAFPWPSFTYTVDGLTVTVNASGSSDDYGIVSYDWDWGDGTTGTGMEATHTYSATMAPSLPDTSGGVRARPPGTPYLVTGRIYDPFGAPLPDCLVNITNKRTGSWNLTVSDYDGYYLFDAGNEMIGSVYTGDLINVTAKMGSWIGWAEGYANTDESYIWMDISLTKIGLPPIVVTITLTVTDTIGQTATVSQQVTLYP